MRDLHSGRLSDADRRLEEIAKLIRSSRMHWNTVLMDQIALHCKSCQRIQNKTYREDQIITAIARMGAPAVAASLVLIPPHGSVYYVQKQNQGVAVAVERRIFLP
jgi:hypothetical protein